MMCNSKFAPTELRDRDVSVVYIICRMPVAKVIVAKIFFINIVILGNQYT